MDIVYTGYFVDDTTKLLREVPIALRGNNIKTYAHHVTKEFKPADELDDIVLGATHIFFGYAQVITDEVQALLVRSHDNARISSNPHPHITIATANGTPPAISNLAIQQAYENNAIQILSREIEIEVTEGYFDGQSVHTH